MFNPDFYPTPHWIIERITKGIDFESSVILEPSAGSGNIVEFALAKGAKVLACEIEPKLRSTLNCKVIAEDFLTVQSDQVSHITHIVMNPPFSADATHILHAWEVAPAGCEIRALCNWETINNPFSRSRKVLKSALEVYGRVEFLGSCFSQAERKTDVEVAYLRLEKPAAKHDEFEGFFMEEEEENHVAGLQRYNFVRDVVSRYIGAVRIFDEQLDAAVRMNDLTTSFFNTKIALSMSIKDAKVTREDYKKELQKAAWNHVLDKMNMQKYITKSVRDDINKFVETQHKVPFTMKNIYAMIHLIVGTQRSRMDTAMEDVFDKITTHYHENRYAVEGWKTNSHYLVNQKFILGGLTEVGWHGEFQTRHSGYHVELIEDLLKALCYITGRDYNQCITLYERTRHRFMVEKDGQILLDKSIKNRAYPRYFKSEEERDAFIEENPGYTRAKSSVWGEWIDWEFFEVKGYKKGTIHFKFKDQDVWAKFNQHIARIKGYPLFEPKKQGGEKCHA